MAFCSILEGRSRNRRVMEVAVVQREHPCVGMAWNVSVPEDFVGELHLIDQVQIYLERLRHLFAEVEEDGHHSSFESCRWR